jgi:hypothetical protein
MSRYIPPHLRKREEVKRVVPPSPIVVSNSASDFPSLVRKTGSSIPVVKKESVPVWNNNLESIRAAAEREEVPDNSAIVERYLRIQAAKTARIMAISRGADLPTQEELADPDYYREKKARADRIADLYYREAIGEFDIVKKEDEHDEWNPHIY